MIDSVVKIVKIQQGDKIPVGISQCLLGEKVRYNGEHKRSPFCTDVLSEYFAFESFCPEVAVGMGIPRKPIRLVQKSPAEGGSVDAVGVNDSSSNPSDALRQYAHKTAQTLGHLRGYILMQKSPSCGMERVTVYHENGNPLHHKGVGLYAEVLQRELPLLPIEESGRLQDAGLRENFIARVYAYDRWKDIEPTLNAKALLDFYSDYKYLIMAHEPQAYSQIGQLLSDMKARPLDDIAQDFIQQLMATLKKPATRKTTTNVLMHIQGYFKKSLSSDEKQELSQVIDQYRVGTIPLIAPVILLQHLLRKHPNDYLKRQAFLRPYPEKLGLRNAV